jgi:hypothetical protein
MKYLINALYAEALKNKRTLAMVLVVVGPAVLTFLEVAVGFQYGKRMYTPGEDSWFKLVDHYMIMWALLMLPLFITLVAGLLGNLEHGNKTWKQLFVLPVPRWAVYMAKQLSGMALIGLSHAVAVGMVVLAGLIMRVMLPELGFDAPIPWGLISKGMLLSFLASWLLISLHTWISMRFSSFVLAMIIGISGTIAGVLVIGRDLSNYYPWTLPGMVGIGYMQQDPYLTPLILGVVGGLVLMGLGTWEMCRQEVL